MRPCLLPLAFAERGLDGGCALTFLKTRGDFVELGAHIPVTSGLAHGLR